MKNILKYLSFFLVTTICLTNMQCEDDNDIIVENNTCELEVVIDETLYNALESASFSFISVEITTEGCLQFEIGASGCSGETWTFSLIDSGSIAESFPEQRFIKLELLNTELCQAVFTRLVTFNIESLQVEGSNSILLNIEGHNTPISYNY